MTTPNFPVPTSFPVSKSGSQEEEKKACFNYKVELGLMLQDLDPAMDPKEIKRIVSNRVSGQKSRWKKRQYIDDLEKRSRELHLQVSDLRTQVTITSEWKRRSEVEQMELKEYLAVWNQHKIYQEGVTQARNAEIESLKRQLTHKAEMKSLKKQLAPSN
ncbi:unnamed protein product [Microthlaspi erraticum]|uniref:BZIP domain-containing protein n=1 Tax=Microthlaspi erraticum TaxID=1685480 RepID=A0A6D2IIP2_9BRAS|nr:unnamed protein product [Microthlaspi erraticum]